MSITKTIGGDRIGSGSKMKTSLHDYGMSTHNLSETFISSMAPGVLVPFYCNVGLNGDVFDFDLDSMARTIPTKAPLFGSFKLQLDMYQCPIRLYHGLLHNNALNIGMKMADVKLPMLDVRTKGVRETTDTNNEQISRNSLLKYLGLSGIGTPDNSESSIHRGINAVPALCYYDIFKNYYANKQEENAYVITPSQLSQDAGNLIEGVGQIIIGTDITPLVVELGSDPTVIEDFGTVVMSFVQEDCTADNVQVSDDGTTWYSLRNAKELQSLRDVVGFNYSFADNSDLVITFTNTDIVRFYIKTTAVEVAIDDISLTSFPLDNIDKMREDLLKDSDLGYSFYITETDGSAHDYLPYSVLVKTAPDGTTFNAFTMNGLCVKTYQSDIFNAWVQTDWITGTNGIASITAVDVSDGELKLDALNLAQKVYNMLNRIAVSGGTYNDWQEAVYSRRAIWHAETPIYIGGMSSEIVFEEIVSTARAGEGADYEALGSLAGKGKLLGKKGGRIHLKVNEPSIIMGIVSITPRLCYTQGNMWYLTDLHSMDDLHKPALDGIGFQDLIGEQMAWWDTKVSNYSADFAERTSVGKVPAWINYMTSFDKAFGDFAQTDSKNFMVLARNYQRAEDNTIADATTYIDPVKFNYPFAYADLSAQNFWVQISTKCIARRIMSAKIIPTL